MMKAQSAGQFQSSQKTNLVGHTIFLFFDNPISGAPKKRHCRIGLHPRKVERSLHQRERSVGALVISLRFPIGAGAIPLASLSKAT